MSNDDQTERGELVAIPHNGEKPAWLEDDARVDYPGSCWRSAWAHGWAADNAGAHLPADHWAAPVIRAGLTPWNPKLQGDGPPGDYAGGKVMFRTGRLGTIGRISAIDWRWHGGDIDPIGYEPAPYQGSMLSGCMDFTEPAPAPATLPADAGVIQAPEEIAASILSAVEWQMSNFMPAKGEASRACEARRLREAIADAIRDDRNQSNSAIAGLVEAASYAQSVLSAIIAHGPDTGIGEHNRKCAIDAKAALARWRGE